MTGRMSEPQTCMIGLCGMERCTVSVAVSGWITGFSPLECEMSETTRVSWTIREAMRDDIVDLWKRLYKLSEDEDLSEQLRTQAKEAARHILRAEMALERPRGGGATSSTASSAEGEVANA
jgi:hypothetical protein